MPTGARLIVFLAAFTPLPYKAVTIASGVVGMDLLGIRAGVRRRGAGCGSSSVAALPAFLGERAEALIRRHARLWRPGPAWRWQLPCCSP